jgi:hypothetical protein
VDSWEIIAVGPMREKDAVALLERKLGRQAENQALADALAYMPLALAQSAAYIQQRGSRLSITRYLEKLQKCDASKKNILDEDWGDLRRDQSSSNSIIRTWQVSFEHVRRVHRSAADRLSLMSFCYVDAIPDILIRRIDSEHHKEELPARTVDDSNSRELAHNEGFPSDGDSESSFDDQFEKDMNVLTGFAFVSAMRETTTFEMHRLVQLAIRRWLHQQRQDDLWTGIFMRNLDDAFVPSAFEDWADCRVLYPHARAAMILQPKAQSALLRKASICYKAGRFAREEGSLTESEEFCCLAREIQEAVLGSEHPDTVASMTNLTATYSKQEKWSETEELQATVLEIRKRVLGAEHPVTLAIMASLATTYSRQEKWSETEEVRFKVFHSRKRVLGAEHPDTLTSAHDLAETYRCQGRWSEAMLLDPYAEDDNDAASVASQQSLQSVFSTGSITSSVSSVSSGNQPFLSGVEKFLEVSAQRNDLVSLLTLAPATISQDKFSRNNARLLKALSKEALTSVISQGARLAGRVLRDKRKRLEISRRLFAHYCPNGPYRQPGRLREHYGVEKIEQGSLSTSPTRDDIVSPQTPQFQAESDSESSAESSAGSEDEDEDDHDELTDFVLHSEVFNYYVRDLWLFLNPVTPGLLIETVGRGDVQRAKDLLNYALNSKVKARPGWLAALADLDLGPGQNEQLFARTLLLKLHEPYTRRVARALTSAKHLEGAAGLMRDLAWVPPDQVRIYVQEDLDVSDLVKERLEHMSGSKWHWWPLFSPKTRIPAGCSRVSWNTVSTSTLSLSRYWGC